MHPRNLIFIVLMLFGSTAGYTQVQETKAEPVPADSEEVFMFVEEMPQFPGGDVALLTYISQNIKYPKEAIKNNTQGIVYISFVVRADGSIRNARVMRELGNGCSEEALRVVKAMPKWIPGRQNGKAVNTQFTIPVNFALSDDR